jgi:tight adherence protein C
MPTKISSAVEEPGAEDNRGIASRIQHAGTSLGNMVGRFEGVLPKSKAEVSQTRQRFIRAGYRNSSAVTIYYGAKVVLSIVLVALVIVTGLVKWNFLLVIFMAIVVGFMAPSLWLGNRVSHRQKQIKRGLPDALDLMVICAVAGMSMDQATARTSQELAKAQPALSDELGVIAMEQHLGCSRSEAWRHLADRTGVDSVRSLVSILVQAEQFGTSISKTLRIQSDTLRLRRVQEVEERAAKTSVKLIIPLALFMFPVLFLVTLGPALILMFESFDSGFRH